MLTLSCFVIFGNVMFNSFVLCLPVAVLMNGIIDDPMSCCLLDCFPFANYFYMAVCRYVLFFACLDLTCD